MPRGELTVVNAKGVITKFINVIKITVSSSMIEVLCMKELARTADQRTTKHGIKGWVSYDLV